FDAALPLEGVDRRRRIEVLEDQRGDVGPRGSVTYNMRQTAEGGVAELRPAIGQREGRAAKGQLAAVGLDDVHPVNAELELVVEGNVVKLGFEVHLAVGALVHAAQVALDLFERR